MEPVGLTVVSPCDVLCHVDLFLHRGRKTYLRTFSMLCIHLLNIHESSQNEIFEQTIAISGSGSDARALRDSEPT